MNLSGQGNFKIAEHSSFGMANPLCSYPCFWWEKNRMCEERRGGIKETRVSWEQNPACKNQIYLKGKRLNWECPRKGFSAGKPRLWGSVPPEPGTHCGCSRIYRLCLKLATEFGSIVCMILASQVCKCKSYRATVSYIKIPESHGSQAVCTRVKFLAMGPLKANE